MSHMEEKRNRQRWWSGNMKERDNTQDLGTDGRTALKWVLQKWDGSECTGFIWLWIWPF